MGLFGGKPKQLKALEKKLTTAGMSFGLFARLPEQNRQHLLTSGSQGVAQAAKAAASAGHADAAKQMLDEAARQTPSGATDELWQAFLAPAISGLAGR